MKVRLKTTMNQKKQNNKSINILNGGLAPFLLHDAILALFFHKTISFLYSRINVIYSLVKISYFHLKHHHFITYYLYFYFLFNKLGCFLDNFFSFCFSLNFLHENYCNVKLVIAYCHCAPMRRT